MGTQSGSSDWIEMRVPQAVLSILLVPLSQCVPVPKPQNGGTSSMSAQTAGLVSLNAMTLVPLLLAGAAFAKGYLVGNIAQRKSRSYGGYGGYGGYHRVGYSPHYQPSYSDYHHRRVDVDSQYPEDEYQTTSESQHNQVLTLQQHHQSADQYYQSLPQYQDLYQDQYKTSTEQYSGQYLRQYPTQYTGQ